jgi:hypothetical protein
LTLEEEEEEEEECSSQLKLEFDHYNDLRSLKELSLSKV